MKLKSYLVFNGNAEEALNFYAEVFNGTKSDILRYKDCPDEETPVGYENKIVLSNLSFNGCTIGLADTLPSMKADFGSLGHATAIFCDTEQQLNDIYTKLSFGGQIKCELCNPSFAKLYSEVLDKFGVLWGLILE